MRQSHAWSFDVGIPDSHQAVEAVKKSRTFPEGAKFIVRSRLTAAHMKALRLKEGHVRPRRARGDQETAGHK
jgi:hypothetical protein